MASPAMSSSEIALLLEISIVKLALGLTVFPEDSLDMGVQHAVFALVKSRVNSPDILTTLCRFFSITSELYESNETQAAYAAMLFIPTFIELTVHIHSLTVSVPSSLIQASFESLRALVNRVNPAAIKSRVMLVLKHDSKQ